MEWRLEHFRFSNYVNGNTSSIYIINQFTSTSINILTTTTVKTRYSNAFTNFLKVSGRPNFGSLVPRQGSRRAGTSTNSSKIFTNNQDLSLTECRDKNSQNSAHMGCCSQNIHCDDLYYRIDVNFLLHFCHRRDSSVWPIHSLSSTKFAI